ncbi:type II secretion system F family protein [Pseudomonas sp. BN411]|uniref:type II secretion system F family protein n=1 Tax=Pseudomonas sp. BN411 TaxID=2567887 RepID=UPI00245442ED|nr:type II secretion system F family protein [Pseudomonas sp. BN411]MDH4559972.1 type II secretion system F family protein [Pseudomonas sp. BN411]
MDYVLGLINGLVGDPQMARLVFLAAVALSAMLAVITFGMLAMGLQSPVQRRLALIKRGHDAIVAGQRPVSNLQLILEQVGSHLMPGEERKASATRQLLSHAGYRSASAVQVYWAVRLLLPLLTLAVAVMVLPMLPKLSVSLVLLVAVSAVALGWLIPAILVEHRKEARIGRLRTAFPDALDLMVVCVESGLALPQAIERVADEMAVSQSELAEELALVNAEIRAGIPSAQALKHLADRTGLEDLHGLVSLLSQSIRFGTSVADTLRIYADEFRDRRTQAAEERAAKIGTKLVFPLIFCLWPSFFLVAIGPAVIGVLRAFGMR